MLKGIFLYLSFMFTCGYSISQQVSLFQNITTANGLPSNYVFASDEDENGFLWIGTDKGLAKYDGFRWQVINMANGLPGNYIRFVFCTGKGGIWLGISTKGTYYYDIATGKCDFITHDSWGHNSQRNKKGDLFFYNAFFDKEIISGNVCEVANPTVAKKVFEIPVDKGSDFLMADFETKTVYYKSTFCSSNDLKTYDSWKKDTINTALKLSGFVTKIKADIYKSTGALMYTNDIATQNKINSKLSQKYYLSALHDNGITWYWNEGDGLFNVDDKGNINAYTDKEGLGTKIIHSAYKTKSGNMFISTLGGGLATMLPQGFATIATDSKPIKSIAQQGNSIFALLDNAILKFDLNSPSSVTKYPHTEKDIEAINIVNKDIVISTLTGFSVYTINSSTLIKKKELKITSGISSVLQQNNLIYAGTYGTHVITFNASYKMMGEDFTTPQVSEKIIPFSQGYISINYEDGLQLNYTNKKRVAISVKEGLPANAVYDVHEHKDTLWVSTAEGVVAYTKGKVVQTFSFSDGIKGNRCIFSFHDAAGKFWVLTDKFLNEFDGRKFLTLTTIAVSDDNNDIANSCLYNNETNTLVIGSLKRIFLINMANIKRQYTAATPSLTTLFYDGNEIDSNYNITLPSQYKSLLLRFKPVDANPFAKSFILYKLQGYHDNFLELKDSLTVSFPKLRPGSYKLLAKTINADGIESPEKTLAIITIDSPYWQKSWFVAFLAASAALGLYSISYLSRKRKQKKITALKLMDEQLAKERERISKDLHDHLGTAIVTMIAQTDNIEAKLMNNNQQGALDKVKELSEQSRETVNVLRETIWAVQENNHSLETFVLRTRNFLQRVLPHKNIEWELDVTGATNYKLTANQSLQFFRIIQEATQNIVKHSGAGKATYTFMASPNLLQLTISDNGKGFDTAIPLSSNGLKNIKQRMAELSGTCIISSNKNNGTNVIVTMPINFTS